MVVDLQTTDPLVPGSRPIVSLLAYRLVCIVFTHGIPRGKTTLFWWKLTWNAVG